MKRAEELIERAREFTRKHPSQSSFAQTLGLLVEQITTEFTGDERDRLLADAEDTFERQRQTIESTRQALYAIEKLKEQQSQLLDALSELATIRPPNTTVH
jgi:hypothetical protein